MGRFLRSLAAGLYLILACPAGIFNLLKLPVVWQFYVQQTADPAAATLLVVFWLLLAFWIARWGSWYFWVSILLQIAFAGFPDVKAAIASSTPDLLDLHTHWSLWVFAASLSLEILDWTRRLRRADAPIA